MVLWWLACFYAVQLKEYSKNKGHLFDQYIERRDHFLNREPTKVLWNSKNALQTSGNQSRRQYSEGGEEVQTIGFK